MAGHDILQLPKVRRAHTRNWVPPLGRVKAGRTAARGVARGDVVEGIGLGRMNRVHEWVQETERRQARGEPRRVEQRDDARKSRSGSRRAPDRDDAPSEEDAEEISLRGNVRNGLKTRTEGRR